MFWTFDDNCIGRTKDNNKVDINIIPRPPGFETNAMWYEYAGHVVNKLNKLDLEEE